MKIHNMTASSQYRILFVSSLLLPIILFLLLTQYQEDITFCNNVDNTVNIVRRSVSDAK